MDVLPESFITDAEREVLTNVDLVVSSTIPRGDHYICLVCFVEKGYSRVRIATSIPDKGSITEILAEAAKQMRERPGSMREAVKKKTS